jgi:cyclic pyranopterin phosphate synthase
MPGNGVTPFKHSQILSYEEIIRVIKTAVQAGIIKIRLTGGEPLVRKNIGYLVSQIVSIPGIVDVGLTTNGVRLKEMAKPLFEDGLRRLNISLDTLNPIRFFNITGKYHFHEVWEGIETVMDLAFDPVKINMVVIRGVNDDELENFAKLSIHTPLHVRFIEYMPVGAGSLWCPEKTVCGDEILTRLGKMGRLIPVPVNHLDGPALRYRFEFSRGEIGIISAVGNHFCHKCNRLRLTADGKLKPCLFSDEEIDIKTPLRRGVSQKKLLKIIENAIAKKPVGHDMGSRQTIRCHRHMSKIGG